MRLALAEAQAALAGDDVPVGAVVLDESGTVIGTGRNTREAEGDPTGHAEVVALRAAAAARGEWRLTGCTLVVTLEPCTMCAGALVLATLVDRLGRVGDVRLAPLRVTWLPPEHDGDRSVRIRDVVRGDPRNPPARRKRRILRAQVDATDGSRAQVVAWRVESSATARSSNTEIASRVPSPPSIT